MRPTRLTHIVNNGQVLTSAWHFSWHLAAMGRKAAAWICLGTVLAYVLLHIRKKLNRHLLRITVRALSAIILSVPLSPLTIYAFNHGMAWVRHKPLEDVTLEMLIAFFIGWATLLYAIFSHLTEKDPLVAGGNEFLDIPSFIVVETEDDLLNLDQSRFLESGFGGLYPGRRRRT